MQRTAQLHLALDVGDAAEPRRTRAVMRLGRPNAKVPSWRTDSPLICPTWAPCVSTSTTPRAIVSWARSRSRSSAGSARRWRGPRPACGQLALGLAGPVVGLARDVGNAADLDRKLLAIVGQPRPLIDQAGDAGSVERLRPGRSASDRGRASASAWFRRRRSIRPIPLDVRVCCSAIGSSTICSPPRSRFPGPLPR